MRRGNITAQLAAQFVEDNAPRVTSIMHLPAADCIHAVATGAAVAYMVRSFASTSDATSFDGRCLQCAYTHCFL